MEIKRKTARPWAEHRNGSWRMSWDALKDTLKLGDVFEFGGIRVGAATLLRLVRTMEGGYDCLIRANERLEVETDRRRVRYADGKRHVSRKLPGFYSSVKIVPNAWLPRWPKVVVVMKPKRLGKRKGVGNDKERV